MFKRIKHIHFVGIGGIGMSGIAEVLHNLGYDVTGSDLKESENTKHLKELGIGIFIGHAASNVEKADVVVRSSAVGSENIELTEARKRFIPIIPRAEMLAELMRMKYGVAVAGTHGKTTTTSMIAAVLAKGGLDPTIVIGGRVNSLNSNAKLGKGEFLVAEADESDGSFLKLSPTIAVVTTVDAEHLDFYQDLDEIKEVFLQFINKVPFYGSAILCFDQEPIRNLLPRVEKRVIGYALSSQADLSAQGIILEGMGSRFTVLFKEKPMGRLTLQVPGRHNISNALAAIAVGLELEVPFPLIRSALEEFTGVARRFQVKGTARGVMVIDDYAHHPAEIKATLDAAKDGFNKRVVAVFQPHRYTRTKALLSEFAQAFSRADCLIVTEIYPAGEPPIPGISGRQIAEGVKAEGHPGVAFVAEKEEIPALLLKTMQPGDLILTMGAGDIWKVADEFLKKLQGQGTRSSKA